MNDRSFRIFGCRCAQGFAAGPGRPDSSAQCFRDTLQALRHHCHHLVDACADLAAVFDLQRGNACLPSDFPDDAHRTAGRQAGQVRHARSGRDEQGNHGRLCRSHPGCTGKGDHRKGNSDRRDDRKRHRRDHLAGGTGAIAQLRSGEPRACRPDHRFRGARKRAGGRFLQGPCEHGKREA